MSESELYPPVRDWLQKRGHEVHVELFDADVIALKDGKITVVELKPIASEKLFRQLRTRSGWADEVWAAIASEPHSLGIFRSCGWGLLQVTDGKVRMKLKARPQPWGWHKRRTYRMKKLTGRTPAMPHEFAGLPANGMLADQRRKRLA